jgi:hypothetical protein
MPEDNALVMRIMVPIGVLLQENMQMKVDGSDIAQIAYGICTQVACIGDFELTSDIVGRMRRGAGGTLSFVYYTGEVVDVPFSLQGAQRLALSLDGACCRLGLVPDRLDRGAFTTGYVSGERAGVRGYTHRAAAVAGRFDRAGPRAAAVALTAGQHPRYLHTAANGARIGNGEISRWR